MNKVSIKHVDNTHGQWLRNLNFYKTELSILRGMLTEIAGKYTSSEVAKEVEHYENQFKIQGNNIDVIAHKIHVNIDKIARQAQASAAGYIDGELLTEHAALSGMVEDEERIASELVRSFRKFAEKWM